MNSYIFSVTLSSLLTFSLSCMETREWSFADEVDITHESFPGLAPKDSLQKLLLESSEDKTPEEIIEPFVDQVTNTCNNNQLEAPFVYAAKKGLANFITYILEKTNIPIEQALLDQALHGAVMHNHTDLALYLLTKGAHPNGYKMTKGHKSVSYTTLDAAFCTIGRNSTGISRFFSPKKNDPPAKLILALLHKGARGKELYGPPGLKWENYMEQHPTLFRVYRHQRHFGASTPKLSQLCLLYASNHPTLDSLVGKYVQSVESLNDVWVDIAEEDCAIRVGVPNVDELPKEKYIPFTKLEHFRIRSRYDKKNGR